MMQEAFQLIIFDEQFDALRPETAFGGTPVCPESARIQWPACECGGNMMYLGKIRAADSILLLFMCQNSPGLCDEWDANSGGNRVVKFSAGKLVPLAPPDAGQVLRNTCYGSKLVSYRANTYSEARAEWAKDNGVSPRKVLGLYGGAPEWLQSEEVPACSECGRAMRFIAQLETGPDYETEMNFGGGGCAYVFDCERCEQSAKLLWQC